VLLDDPAVSLPAAVRLSTTWLLGDSSARGRRRWPFGYGTRPLVPLMGD
jgi:hypothetical protein